MWRKSVAWTRLCLEFCRLGKGAVNRKIDSLSDRWCWSTLCGSTLLRNLACRWLLRALWLGCRCHRGARLGGRGNACDWAAASATGEGASQGAPSECQTRPRPGHQTKTTCESYEKEGNTKTWPVGPSHSRKLPATLQNQQKPTIRVWTHALPRGQRDPHFPFLSSFAVYIFACCAFPVAIEPPSISTAFSHHRFSRRHPRQ